MFVVIELKSLLNLNLNYFPPAGSPSITGGVPVGRGGSLLYKHFLTVDDIQPLRGLSNATTAEVIHIVLLGLVGNCIDAGLFAGRHEAEALNKSTCSICVRQVSLVG